MYRGVDVMHARQHRRGAGARLAAAGILALQFAGPIACGLLIVALGLAVLRERRMRIVIPTLAGTALVLVLVFQVWR